MKKLLVACAISASVVLAACGKKEVSVPPTETDSVTAGVEVTAEVTTERETEVTTEETVETETSETATDEVITEESGEGVTGETQTVTETETETTVKVPETSTEAVTETTETPKATEAPTEKPTEKPTEAPTEAPKPTEAPTEKPTEKPTEAPTVHTHNYTSTVTKNSTCTENGIMTFTCECGDTYTAEIGKIDHNFVDYVYNNDATTESDGTETGHCSMCNLAHTRTAAGTKLDKPALPNCPYPLNQFIGNFDGTDQNFCGEAFVTYWVDNSDTSAVRYSPCARDMSTIYEWTVDNCRDNFEIAWNDSYVGEYAEGKVWKSAICLTPESMLPSCPYTLGEAFWDGDTLCMYSTNVETTLKLYIRDVLGESIFDWDVNAEASVHYKEGRISLGKAWRK